VSYSNSMFRCAHDKLVALAIVALVFLVATTGPTQAQTVPNRSATGWSSLPPEARRTILAALEKDDAGLTQQAELTASDGAASDGLGRSVAVDGSTIVVGAPYHPYLYPNWGPGAAYVFVESGGTWTQRAELTASDGASRDQFGISVAVSGTTVVVGAPQHTAGSNQYPGAAYVFVESGGTWSQQAELSVSDGGGDFGWSVAVSGSTVLVGDDGQTVGSNAQQGAAYVFVESAGTWSQQAELTASDGAFFDQFGISVAVSGGTAVVGANLHTVGSNTNQGSAYVFVESGGTWSQQAELTASDGAKYDNFGWSVAVSGGTAVVGADGHTASSPYNAGQGAAYVFVESGGTWSQQGELTASDGKVGDDFGASVAISGGTAVVGADRQPVSGPGNPGPGAAYVFVESGGTWSQQSELTASDGSASDNFGASVAVSGSMAVVGAFEHTVGSNRQQGATYVFGSSSSGGAPVVKLSATSFNFGNRALDATSAAKTVTLKNTGTATLTFAGNPAITPSTNFKISSNTCASTLVAGRSCKVSVEFDPTLLGALMASLAFTDNASNSPQTVALSGTGIADAMLVPASATYAPHKVGTTSAARTFTLTNNQPVALASIATSTTGDFAVSATTCGTSLGAKAKCTISLTFTPTATGTRTGQLIVNDGASNSPQSSNLTGTGK
jgi:hypothetical protein